MLRVNGIGITDAELGQARRSVEAGLKGQPLDEQTMLRRSVEQVIGHALLVQAAREAGVNADAAEVRKRVDAQRARYSTPEAFTQALQQSGLSEQELLRHEEENLILLRFTESVLGPKAAITPAEAQTYYDANPKEFDHPEQVKVRMILVSVPGVESPEADKAAKDRIDRAAARLAAGEDFAKVAAEVSDDPTKSRGGEVGWVRSGMLLPELDSAVFALKPGEGTKPIRTKYGYHLMRADERRPAGRSSFEEVEAGLTNMLKGVKVREQMRQLVTERRASAKVETLDPAITAALASPSGAPR